MLQILRKLFHSAAAVVTASLLLGIAPLAQAEAPQVKTQAPGYYRLMHGQFEVTALFDGAIGLDIKLLKYAKEEDLQRLLARMFVDSPKMQTAVNAFLINTGSKLVLVDAGAGNAYGPGLGFVMRNLTAAGYRPEQIDAVLVTHMHGDHIAGLNGTDGQPLFPNASIHVAQADSDFWLSPANERAAPESMKRMFTAARTISAPYRQQGKWKTFTPGTQLLPGITSVDTRGHTPGHTAFAIESEGKRLLIWGDLVHSHAVQFARPEVAIEFDVDPKQAIATRLAVFKAVAKSGELVAGMHLPFPGIGRVSAGSKGRYRWVPVEYAPVKN